MFSFEGTDSTEAVGWFNGHSLRKLENGNVLYYDNSDRRSDENTHVIEWKLDKENYNITIVY